MKDPQTFEILFRGKVQSCFDYGKDAHNKTAYYGFCDNKSQKENDIKAMPDLFRYFFVEVYDISEARVYLRRYNRNKNYYKRVNPKIDSGKYVFVYILKNN